MRDAGTWSEDEKIGDTDKLLRTKQTLEAIKLRFAYRFFNEPYDMT